MTKTAMAKWLNGVKLPALLSAGALALTACAAPIAGGDGLYAKPAGGAPVVSNSTPYSAALVCLGQFSRANGVTPPRIAVGRIGDFTAKVDVNGGRQITQGASLMAISAFAKAGARLVERFDTSVSELELRYANNKLISDDAVEGGDSGFRQIVAGQVPGSDFYLVGGITELNFNIASNGVDGFGGDQAGDRSVGFLNARQFVLNVGLDLRLVETRTLEVIDVISYQKQIIGKEIEAGIFSFFNFNLIDISAGGSSLEPIQLAVRSVIERAVLEMTANLYGVAGPEVCQFDDPLSTVGETGDFYLAFDNAETNNALTRADADRWHVRRDDHVDTFLVGRYE